MDWSEKAWGRTRHVSATPEASIWELDVVPGGYCSKHRHATRANLFVVVEGDVDVSVWNKRGHEMKVRLTAGGKALWHVPAGTWHRFRAVGRAKIIEMYLPDGGPIDETDIERADSGGVCAAA